jgi:tetratricopeptide (TPR) repeat protein
VLLAVPLAYLWEAAGPYDDPKAWALQILAMLTGLAWLATASGTHAREATSSDVPSRVVGVVVLGLLLWTAITTVTSIAPLQSLLGTFGRGIGFVTIASAILLFFVIQAECRSPRAVQSLVDAALVGSVPVCVLALAQAVGWDPLPKPWDPAVASLTVRSTFGSHIFLGSYLVVLIPLTVARLDWAFRQRKESGRWLRPRTVDWVRTVVFSVWVIGSVTLIGLASHWSLLAWTLVPWGIVGAVGWTINSDTPDRVPDTSLTVSLLCAGLAGQVLVVILSQARGAFIAMLFGLSVVSFAFLIRRRAWKTLAAAALGLCVAVVFLALLNLPDSPAAPLRKVLLLSRLGEISDIKRGSPGWVRLQVWNGIIDGWDRHFRGEEIIPGFSPRVRSAIGYGPDTQLLALAPLTTPFLRSLQAHTAAWRAQYAIDRAHNIVLDHLVTEGLVGACWYLVVAATIITVGTRRIRASVVAGEATLRIGALGAILGHLADGQVGIATSMSLALFWMGAALLTGPRWRVMTERSRVKADERRTIPRWRTVALVAAGVLTLVLGWASTRSLLASIAYAEATRHALGGRLAAAHENFRTSVALAPWLLTPAEGLSTIALRLSDRETVLPQRLAVLHEADAALARARYHATGGAASWTLAGQLAFSEAIAGERNRLPVSRDAFAEALRRQPDNGSLLAQLAWVWLESGDAAQARRIAEQAVARDPRAWLGWTVLARSARELGDPSASGQAAVKARALAPPEARHLVERMAP